MKRIKSYNQGDYYSVKEGNQETYYNAETGLPVNPNALTLIPDTLLIGCAIVTTDCDFEPRQEECCDYNMLSNSGYCLLTNNGDCMTVNH